MTYLDRPLAPELPPTTAIDMLRALTALPPMHIYGNGQHLMIELLPATKIARLQYRVLDVLTNTITYHLTIPATMKRIRQFIPTA